MITDLQLEQIGAGVRHLLLLLFFFPSNRVLSYPWQWQIIIPEPISSWILIAGVVQYPFFVLPVMRISLLGSNSVDSVILFLLYSTVVQQLADACASPCLNSWAEGDRFLAAVALVTDQWSSTVIVWIQVWIRKAAAATELAGFGTSAVGALGTADASSSLSPPKAILLLRIPLLRWLSGRRGGVQTLELPPGSRLMEERVE